MKQNLEELLKSLVAVFPQVVNNETIDGTVIDRLGYDELMVDCQAGAIAATGDLLFALQHGDLANGTDQANVAGGAGTLFTDADDNKAGLLSIDARGLKRFVRVTVTNAAAVAADASAMMHLMNSHRTLPEDNSGLHFAKRIPALG